MTMTMKKVYCHKRIHKRTILTFKLLVERAISSNGYEFHILMLDMSRAFDTIQRGSLIKHLKSVLEPDEVHLVSLLIKDVTIQVKCDGHIGREFTTNIGSPQGDCASPILFIYELSIALKKSKELIESYSNIRVIQNIKNDHTFSKCAKEPSAAAEHNFSMGREYVDDCSFGSTNGTLIDKINETVPEQLNEHNLGVNSEKTERTLAKHGEGGDE